VALLVVGPASAHVPLQAHWLLVLHGPRAMGHWRVAFEAIALALKGGLPAPAPSPQPWALAWRFGWKC
jgi:hypothetical protein